MSIRQLEDMCPICLDSMASSSTALGDASIPPKDDAIFKMSFCEHKVHSLCAFRMWMYATTHDNLHAMRPMGGLSVVGTRPIQCSLQCPVCRRGTETMNSWRWFSDVYINDAVRMLEDLRGEFGRFVAKPATDNLELVFSNFILFDRIAAYADAVASATFAKPFKMISDAAETRLLKTFASVSNYRLWIGTFWIQQTMQDVRFLSIQLHRWVR